MTFRSRRTAAAVAVIAANMMLFSCSSGPQAPQKGTPAFYWDAAKQTYAAGDYVKTLEHLDSIVATDNEFTAKARAWQLVLSSGLARGYMDIADYFESGARINKADPLAFRKQVSQARGFAGRLALRFADSFGAFQKGKDDPVVLSFPFPTGNATPVLLLTKVGNGILPQPTEIETAQKAALSRAVLLTTCAASGSPDDAAKAQEAFKAAEVKVERPIFVLTMANALYDAAQLYTRDKLDDPQKLAVFCERAQEALKSLPESKESKELGGKIEKILKANKA
jgi:hypothetical protein